MLIKLNSKQNSSCFAYIISEVAQLNKLLSKKEKAFLNIKDRTKNKLFTLSRLDVTIYIIKVGSPNLKQKEKKC